MDFSLQQYINKKPDLPPNRILKHLIPVKDFDYKSNIWFKWKTLHSKEYVKYMLSLGYLWELNNEFSFYGGSYKWFDFISNRKFYK